MDIWDGNATLRAENRSAVVGAAFTAGICSNSKYSIVEYAGFNSISIAAHELGHR
jgi:hypothetical protein